MRPIANKISYSLYFSQSSIIKRQSAAVYAKATDQSPITRKYDGPQFEGGSSSEDEERQYFDELRSVSNSNNQRSNNNNSSMIQNQQLRKEGQSTQLRIEAYKDNRNINETPSINDQNDSDVDSARMDSADIADIQIIVEASSSPPSKAPATARKIDITPVHSQEEKP